jgi:transposase
VAELHRGRRRARLDLQLDRFIGWMDGRYKGMDDGTVTEAQCHAARRTLVGDEWRAIRKNLPGGKGVPSAAARLLDILSEGRKAGICALVASHLDTAEGMGISGEKDMLKCFDMVIYLGAMATKYVPAAARMARPAVVYDPEHEVWAQLLIALPANSRESPALDEAAAPAHRSRPASGAPARPASAPAPIDDLLTGLLAGVTPPPDPALPPDLSAISPARAARLAVILGRQGVTATDLALTATSTTSTTAPRAHGADTEANTAAPQPVPPASERGENAFEVPVPVPSGNGNGNGAATRSDVFLMPGKAGELRIIVDARAEAVTPPTTAAPPKAPHRRTRPRGLRSVDVRTRRLVALYRKAGADGTPFKQMYARYRGTKNVVFPAWQQGRAQAK